MPWHLYRLLRKFLRKFRHWIAYIRNGAPRLGAPHIAAFTQKALVLQKKCVQRSDFEGAKVIHDGLEELKKNNFDWRLVKETCQISIPRDGWYGSVANMIHKLDAEGNHYDIQEFRKKFKNTGEKVNTELTGPDLIVFTGAPNRLVADH